MTVAEPGTHPSEKLADRVAEIAAKGFLRAREQMGPEHHTARHAALRAFADDLEQEMKPMLGKIRDTFASAAVDGTSFGALLDQAAEPTHAADMLGGLVQGVVFAFVFQVMQLMTPIVLQDLVDETWSEHAGLELSPGEAATAVVKGHLTEAEGASEVKVQGINARRFGIMVDTTGNPPGPQALQEALRRNLISENRFDEGIRQGLSRTDWIPTFKALAYGPPSAGTAISAAVQNHRTPDEAKEIVRQNGIDPSNFDWMLETAGRPPGIVQMLMAWNHGFVTEAEVVQAIRESDIKNKYIPSLLAMRRHFMPMRSVAAAIAHGAFTHEAGLAYLQTIGYTVEDATVIANTSSSQKTAGAKTAGLGLVERAYRERLIDAGTATARLVELGYAQTEAAFILGVQDALREEQMESHAVGVVRAQYTKRHIDRASASLALDTIGILSSQRDELLLQWDIEQAVIVKELPIAELNWAVHAGVITVDEYAARAFGMGYAPADVEILVAHHAAAAAAPGVTP